MNYFYILDFMKILPKFIIFWLIVISLSYSGDSQRWIYQAYFRFLGDLRTTLLKYSFVFLVFCSFLCYLSYQQGRYLSIFLVTNKLQHFILDIDSFPSLSPQVAPYSPFSFYLDAFYFPFVLFLIDYTISACCLSSFCIKLLLLLDFAILLLKLIRSYLLLLLCCVTEASVLLKSIPS